VKEFGQLGLTGAFAGTSFSSSTGGDDYATNSIGPEQKQLRRKGPEAFVVLSGA
jgi:hypothetical protein